MTSERRNEQITRYLLLLVVSSTISWKNINITLIIHIRVGEKPDWSKEATSSGEEMEIKERGRESGKGTKRREEVQFRFQLPLPFPCNFLI